MNTTQTLYVIVARDKIGGASERSLAAAAERAGLQYRQLVVEDTALDDLAAMTFESSGLLYRLSINPKAATIESALAALHTDKVTTIYWPKPQLGPTRRYAEMFGQIAAGLPIIPSKIVDDSWLQLSDEALTEKVNQLAGFPVLFKTLGLSHGAGVQKFENLAELRTAIQQAVEQNTQAVLREYLPSYRHYRVIVVDNHAVAAIEYHQPADDFRTNAADVPDVSAVDLASLDPAIVDIAIQSVRLASSLIGGVDILVDTTKNVPYLAEVNVPCNFSRAEGPTGVDISGLIVTALIKKAQDQS